MESFTIEATRHTPEVLINFGEGMMYIKGRSYSEDSMEFFTPIFANVRTYFENPQPSTTFDFQFEYLNSSSFKLVVEVLILIKKLSPPENKLIVKWRHEKDDDDMLTLGEEASRVSALPIDLIAY
ncbi:MAG: DUF1987 domain-containing protein [Bacteroidia bacterium]